MNKSFWKAKLLPFLEANKGFNKSGEVYSLREDTKATFWFEGGVKVIGDESNLQVNMSDPDLLILATVVGKKARIYRIPYGRLVCFELIVEGGNTTIETVGKFSPN